MQQTRPNPYQSPRSVSEPEVAILAVPERWEMYRNQLVGAIVITVISTGIMGTSIWMLSGGGVFSFSYGMFWGGCGVVSALGAIAYLTIASHSVLMLLLLRRRLSRTGSSPQFRVKAKK